MVTRLASGSKFEESREAGDEIVIELVNISNFMLRINLKCRFYLETRLFHSC